MQLYCKSVAGTLVVAGTHEDGQSVDPAAYGEGVVVLPYGGPLTAADLLGRPVPAIDLPGYAAAKRFAVETGGITVAGARIATDRQSQAMIGNAFAYVQASGAGQVSYKTAAGFVTLSVDQIRSVALAVGAHVQACFMAEDGVDAALHASPPTITDIAGVDAAFAGLGA